MGSFTVWMNRWILCLFFRPAVTAQEVSPPPIWPAPQRAAFSKDDSRILRIVNLADGFDFVYDSTYNAQILDILEQARSRLVTSLIRSIPRDAAARPVNPRHQSLWNVWGIHITITNPDDIDLRHGVDESYRLELRPVVDNDSYLLLQAPTVYGILHGLQTLRQLLPFGWIDGVGGAPVYTIAGGASWQILDRPAYPYRGLMIDTSRHYLPLTLILDTLDAMAMNKLNVLHWHVVDSQSWPFQSDRFPELSAQGAYCAQCVYSRSDIVHVIGQAALRGIRVVPEFDLPGHSQALGASHPEWLTACEGGHKEPLDVTLDAVYDFVYGLYDEISETFTDDWIHIGGDEVSLDCWKDNQQIQDWKKRHNMTEDVELLQYFETKLLSHVHGNLQKRPVVWQELFDSGLEIPANVVVDVWKDWGDWRNHTMSEATAQGFTVILSACWYLDHLDEDLDHFYNCNPLDFDGTTLQKKLVAGGHACMWGEHVDETNFVQRTWPRTSATAEKLWTGESAAAKASYGGRLHHFRCFMVEQGYAVSPVGPGSCFESMDVDGDLATTRTKRNLRPSSR